MVQLIIGNSGKKKKKNQTGFFTSHNLNTLICILCLQRSVLYAVFLIRNSCLTRDFYFAQYTLVNSNLNNQIQKIIRLQIIVYKIMGHLLLCPILESQ